MKPTTLYRLFSADNQLLYVGVAGNPGRRFEQHAGEKPWWGEVAITELEHFATREEALAAERVAIRDEAPLYNVVHSIRENQEWVVTLEQRIRMVCSGCGSVIAGESGYLEIDSDAAYSKAMRVRAYEREQADKLYQTLSDYPFEAPVQWSAWHRKCDPDPDGNFYWIGSERLVSWTELMEWTAHLSGKVWAEYTNWFDMVRVLGPDTEPLRLTVERQQPRKSA